MDVLDRVAVIGQQFGDPVRALDRAAVMRNQGFRAEFLQPAVDRRQALAAAGRPFVVREVHGVFVTVDLHALLVGMVLVGVSREAARVAAPHVPFRAAFDDPFGEHLAGTARLGDAEGEDAGFVSVRHARHRTDERVAVRRVGDRPVDDLVDAGGTENRHPFHRILDIPFEPVEIVRIKLEGKILRHRIVRRRPVRTAIALVGAEIEAEFFLAQIIGAVDVAQQR